MSSIVVRTPTDKSLVLSVVSVADNNHGQEPGSSSCPQRTEPRTNPCLVCLSVPFPLLGKVRQRTGCGQMAQI